MRISNTWQYKELKKCLANSSSLRTVKLVHPEQRAEIDRWILDGAWQGVLEPLATHRLTVACEGIPEIEDGPHPDTGRKLTFVLDDPEWPIAAGRPWFCRGMIEASSLDYMISFDLSLFFPEFFDLEKILRLLKNPSFAGLPPELHFEREIDGTGCYIIKFTKGFGAGSYSYSTAEMKVHMMERLQENIDIIEASGALAMDYQNAKRFNQMEALICYAYTFE